MIVRLTVREVRCLLLLGEGLRNKEIGARLGVAERTVSNTLQSAYRKLGVSSRQDAMAEFKRNWSETGHRLSIPSRPKPALLAMSPDLNRVHPAPTAPPRPAS